MKKSTAENFLMVKHSTLPLYILEIGNDIFANYIQYYIGGPSHNNKVR